MKTDLVVCDECISSSVIGRGKAEDWVVKEDVMSDADYVRNVANLGVFSEIRCKRCGFILWKRGLVHA